MSCLAWCAGRPLRGNEAFRVRCKGHRLRIRIGLFVTISLNTMSSVKFFSIVASVTRKPTVAPSRRHAEVVSVCAVTVQISV